MGTVIIGKYYLKSPIQKFLKRSDTLRFCV